MKSENLVKVIKLAGSKLLNEHEFCELNHANHFNRELFFVLLDNEYQIEWFSNLMTLTTPDGLEVKFTSVEYSSTWPNGFKMSLQFRYGKECVAILGVERYAKDILTTVSK